MQNIQGMARERDVAGDPDIYRVGIYFLLDGFASGERGAGFLLSSLVTTLTTYGIFTHTISISEPAPHLDLKIGISL